MSDEQAVEFYRKHRPRAFKSIAGQEEAVSMVTKLLEKGLPHAMLFSGPSGCGKTTIARILKDKLGCSDMDFHEMNCADVRGIENVREIRSRMPGMPLGGTVRIFLIDEAHKLTGDAQNALLKLLEDTPRHVYFFICTTDPGKLINTIITRCTEIKLKGMTPAAQKASIARVAEKEGIEVSADVVDQIVDVAEGSARKAIVLLNQVAAIEGDEARIACIQKASAKTAGINIARALINPKPNWKEVAGIIKANEDEPETVRRIVLGYCASVMLGGSGLAQRAAFVADCFEKNFYDSGKAGLVLAAYQACHG